MNIDKVLRKLGEHEEFGDIVRDWLEGEKKTLNDLSRARDWEEVLRNKGAMRFINKLLAKLDKDETAPKERITRQYE
jgi:hypothetical protein